MAASTPGLCRSGDTDRLFQSHGPADMKLLLPISESVTLQVDTSRHLN